MAEGDQQQQQSGNQDPNAAKESAEKTEAQQADDKLGLTPEPFTLPDKWKGEKSLQTFKSLDDVLKTVVHSQKELGASIRLPKEKDTDEEKATKLADIHSKLGRPKDAASYEVELPAFDDEQAEWDDGLVKGFKELAFKHGLNNAGLQEFLNYYAEYVGNSVVSLEDMDSQYRQELEDSMGSREFKRTAALSYAAVKELGGQELSDYLTKTGQGNHPILVRAFAKAGHMLREAGSVDAAVVDSTLSRDDAQRRFDEIRTNPEDIYHRKFAGQPGHAERVMEVNELIRIINA